MSKRNLANHIKHGRRENLKLRERKKNVMPSCGICFCQKYCLSNTTKDEKIAIFQIENVSQQHTLNFFSNFFFFVLDQVWLEKRYVGSRHTSEWFNTAGRNVKTGLIASVIVSQVCYLIRVPIRI